jgi:UDPglucose--hexose-1-phosphate uridylyltransferase
MPIPKTPLQTFDAALSPHRRLNILTGDWILVSPHRTQRPWQGEQTAPSAGRRPKYDPACYLCPGNTRANGSTNPAYDSTYVFTNDFSSLLIDAPSGKTTEYHLLQMKSERGICRVVNFSPRHDLTLAEMDTEQITKVVSLWREEYASLGSNPKINYVQIFENKGAMMGNSNPHPHCQIWAQESIPMEPRKELQQFKKYYAKTKRSLLAEYVRVERADKARLVYENASFVAVVPFWAVWPYETMIISRRKIASLLQFTEREKADFAETIRVVTVKYDNLFQTSFPYSSGLHQAPTDGKDHPEWHFHMHFYPPLLRSASIKKFMVGYEMLAEPQRDITPEHAASVLRGLSTTHFAHTA